jgi:hypothetical protein
MAADGAQEASARSCNRANASKRPCSTTSPGSHNLPQHPAPGSKCDSSRLKPPPYSIRRRRMRRSRGSSVQAPRLLAARNAALR